MAEPDSSPAWFLRLLTLFFARNIAHDLAAKNPGLGPQQIAEKMRADLGRPPNELESKLIDAVVARLPRAAPAPAPARAAQMPASAWVLVAANLLPLFGVLFWGWDVFPLLVLFWMENVVIGVLNALRMLCAYPANAVIWAGKLFMVPLFCVHYGGFTAAHGLFVFALFGGSDYRLLEGFSDLEPAVARAAADFHLWLPIAVLVASHLFSFFWNYLYRGEFRRAHLGKLMVKPYVRVVVLHLTILFGGFGAMALGSPLWALLLLLALKIGLDLKAHLKEHSPAAP